jgi:hypothetical protein
MSNYRYRVYNKENEKGVYLFPTYFNTKKQAIEHSTKVPNAVIQKKCGSFWYAI